MSFCKQCGTQLNDGAAFCKNCGTKVGAEQNTNNMFQGNIYGAVPPTGNENNYNATIDKTKQMAKEVKVQGTKLFGKLKEHIKGLIEKSKTDKKTAIGLGVGTIAVVALVIGIIAGITMDKRIAVDECIVVELDGYNGTGRVYSYYLDEELFAKQFMSATSAKTEDEARSNMYYLMNNISLYTSTKEGLENGDDVIVEISYDNDIAHEYGIKFTGDTYTLEVSGLGELAEYNPFEHLEVYFEGIAPNASVYYDMKDGMLSESRFSVDKKTGLSSGDVVTITYNGDVSDLEEYGYKISKMSQEYTCENISAYVTKSAEVTGKLLENMSKDAKDCIEVYFANNYQYISCDNLQYVGNYVLMNKKMSGNMVCIVYSGTVSSKETNPVFTSQTVYFPIEFSSVITNGDGTSEYDLMSSNIYGTTDLKFNGWSNVRGYTNGQNMFNDLVQVNKVKYTYDVSEKLTQFGSVSTTEETTKNTTGQDYILSNSNSAYLTEKDLEGLTQEQLRLARNELYARYGYIFEDEGLKNYFDQKSWYQGTVAKENFNESVFNEYETANKDFIVNYETQKGYR